MKRPWYPSIDGPACTQVIENEGAGEAGGLMVVPQIAPRKGVTMGQPIEDAELVKRFTYHKPKEDQPARYEALREAGLALARLIVANTPASREQALALTKLEESIMHANSAIARNE